MKQRRLHKLFADYFGLKMVLLINLIHFAGMLIFSVASRLHYRYFALHFNTAGGPKDLARLLFFFLLPSILAFLAALLFRAIDKKPKALRTAVRAVTFCAIAAAMVYACVLTFIFSYSMPFASCTKNPANIGKYDEMVMQSLPSNSCPDLIRAIPEEAEDVDFSYWYIQIMDHEWKISVAYSLPEERYRAVRDDALGKLEAMGEMTVTETEAGVTWDTVDYRTGLGRAYNRVTFTYDDESCRITYVLDSFRYDTL